MGFLLVPAIGDRARDANAFPLGFRCYVVTVRPGVPLFSLDVAARGSRSVSLHSLSRRELEGEVVRLAPAKTLSATGGKRNTTQTLETSEKLH